MHHRLPRGRGPRWRMVALALCAAGAGVLGAAGAAAPTVAHFDFGRGRETPGAVRVPAETEFDPQRGYGFESGAELTEFGGDTAALSGGIGGAKPFFFSAAVPGEGNYRVRVVLGRSEGPSDTTVKAELRRLMIERVQTAAGFTTRTFLVNVRSPSIAARPGIAAGVVRLKAPRETTQEAWAWDRLLTLEFNGPAPAVREITIERADVPTIFLLGDSTVCDQSREPYNSWGQMLPAFFTDAVAIANHGESGETYRDSIARRRLDKIISVMQPGDWLLMQFGHNDQKQIAAGTGGPFTTYQDEIRTHLAAVRQAGGVPVVISPMERRNFDAHGRVVGSLDDYARAAREVAEQEEVAFIDLHAMSRVFYEALGPERSALAFAAPDGVVDNTHHNNYGSYELARCVVQGIRAAQLNLARFIAPQVAAFDPAHPDEPETFAVPSSPIVTTQRPLGD